MPACLHKLGIHTRKSRRPGGRSANDRRKGAPAAAPYERLKNPLPHNIFVFNEVPSARTIIRIETKATMPSPANGYSFYLNVVVTSTYVGRDSDSLATNDDYSLLDVESFDPSLSAPPLEDEEEIAPPPLAAPPPVPTSEENKDSGAPGKVLRDSETLKKLSKDWMTSFSTNLSKSSASLSKNLQSTKKSFTEKSGKSIASMSERSAKLSGQAKQSMKNIGKNITEGSKTIGKNITEGSKSIGKNITEGSKSIGKNITEGSKTIGKNITEGSNKMAKQVQTTGATMSRRTKQYVAIKTMVTRAERSVADMIPFISATVLGDDASNGTLLIRKRFQQGTVFVLEVDLKGCDLTLLLSKTLGETSAQQYSAALENLTKLGLYKTLDELQAEILPQIRIGLMLKLSNIVPAFIKEKHKDLVRRKY